VGHAGAALPDSVLVLNAVRELFDHGVGQNFARDALNLRPRILGCEAGGEGKREILALADTLHLRESDLAQGVVDGLTLRIQY